jgi:hypothetical protein
LGSICRMQAGRRLACGWIDENEPRGLVFAPYFSKWKLTLEDQRLRWKLDGLEPHKPRSDAFSANLDDNLDHASAVFASPRESVAISKLWGESSGATGRTPTNRGI